MSTIILASASPRRRSLLEGAGFSVEVSPPEVDESREPGESPTALVERLARVKAAAVTTDRAHPIVAGDTVVEFEGDVLGKPRDEAEAFAMLRRLSGSRHQVLSGWCVRRGALILSGVESTTVTFRALGEEEIRAYVATGEPLDKAGAYGIQERGGTFVASLEGSLENVIGLPVAVVTAAIERALSSKRD